MASWTNRTSLGKLSHSEVKSITFDVFRHWFLELWRYAILELYSKTCDAKVVLLVATDVFGRYSRAGGVL